MGLRNLLSFNGDEDSTEKTARITYNQLEEVTVRVDEFHFTSGKSTRKRYAYVKNNILEDEHHERVAQINFDNVEWVDPIEEETVTVPRETFVECELSAVKDEVEQIKDLDSVVNESVEWSVK